MALDRLNDLVRSYAPITPFKSISSLESHFMTDEEESAMKLSLRTAKPRKEYTKKTDAERLFARRKQLYRTAFSNTLSTGTPAQTARSPIELMQHMVAGTMGPTTTLAGQPGGMMMQPMSTRPMGYSNPMVPTSMMPMPIPDGMRPMPSGNPPPSAGVMPGPPPPNAGPLNGGPTPMDFRIHDMNRRMNIFNTSGINEKDHAQWWDAFSHEFFDDECRVMVIFHDHTSQQPPERYAFGRQLVPRFFRSFVDSGVKEFCWVIQGPSRETMLPNGLLSYENDSVLQHTKIAAQCPIEVRTECKFYMEFAPYDDFVNYRIRTWTMELRSSQEFYANEVGKDMQMVEIEPAMHATRMGFTQNTLNCLSLSRILEPMQLLMVHNKQTPGMEPQDTMRRTIFNHRNFMNEMQQRMSQPPMMAPAPVEEPKPKPARKRTRKPAANAKNKKSNASPAPTNPQFPTPMSATFNTMGYQDVMVVGEPSMMGGDYGEEDERTISRVENSQYDPNALQMQQSMTMSSGMMTSTAMGGPPGAPMGHMPPPNGLPPHAMANMPPGPPQMTQMGPPQNGMPPPYSFSQPPAGSWPNQPPNTTMITG